MSLTADRAIERYFRERAAAGARSHWIAKSSGWRWAEKCAACFSDTRQLRLIDPRNTGRLDLGAHDWIMRCTKCGTAWEHENVSEIPHRRGSREGPAVPIDATEDRMLDYATLAVAIWTVPHGPRWTPQRWALHLDLLLDQVLNGTAVTALVARVGSPVRTVERMLWRARTAIEARL